ncbi:MAG TPA: hypothetical protein VN039_03755 [Nitrospira sp.]|nr:hypothetical protein [Nitrospira sp.]
MNNEDENLQITVELVEDEHTTIKTREGNANIAPGNYIATDQNGDKFGITGSDLKALYSLAKAV